MAGQYQKCEPWSLELGDSEVLGRVKVPSDSDIIALLRLAYFEGFVNYLGLESKPSSAKI